jgi:hypothetical protein
MNTRREEWHAAELTARDYENKAQIDGLREALYLESRIKDAVIDRLHKANEDLFKAQQANCSVQSSGHEQLVTQIELLQELLRTTNSSLAALEERCKSQEREFETLRQNAAAHGARDALQSQEMQGPLAAQVEDLKAGLQQSEWERAQQQVALFADSRRIPLRPVLYSAPYIFHFDRWKLTFYSVPKIALIPCYHRFCQTELFGFIFPRNLKGRFGKTCGNMVLVQSLGLNKRSASSDQFRL